MFEFRADRLRLLRVPLVSICVVLVFYCSAELRDLLSVDE